MMLNTWMSKPQLPGQGKQGRRLGIKHGLNRRWETGGHTHTRLRVVFPVSLAKDTCGGKPISSPFERSQSPASCKPSDA